MQGRADSTNLESSPCLPGTLAQTRATGKVKRMHDVSDDARQLFPGTSTSEPTLCRHTTLILRAQTEAAGGNLGLTQWHAATSSRRGLKSTSCRRLPDFGVQSAPYLLAVLLGLL